MIISLKINNKKFKIINQQNNFKIIIIGENKISNSVIIMNSNKSNYCCLKYNLKPEIIQIIKIKKLENIETTHTNKMCKNK